MAADEYKYPTAYINPFMDKLYEWGYAEGLWEDKRDLLHDLDSDALPSESLKSFLLKNDIPEWYYKNGWGMNIGAGQFSHIIEAWEQDAPHQYGHYIGRSHSRPGVTKINPSALKVSFELWDDNIPCVGIALEGEFPVLPAERPQNIWWYNPIIFTPTPGKSWFGDAQMMANFYLLNWKENPFDSIK